MTQNEIIEMARQAGAKEYGTGEEGVTALMLKDGAIEIFAKLVEDAAFKRWAAQTKLAVESEREACAKIFDDAKGTGRIASCREAAAAIRARGQE